jgi:hypothetical protein
MEQTFIMIKPDGVQSGMVRGLFLFFFESVIFFTVYESCVWLNQNFRKGKESFGFFFFFPIFLRPELASS